MTQSRDDARLVAAAKAGDRSAFGALYQRYARLVHGVLLARVDPADADDLSQDVFLHAMNLLHDLHTSRNHRSRPRLARTCRHVHRTRKRSAISGRAVRVSAIRHDDRRNGRAGQRIEVTGQVFAPDGRTPAAGVIMYLYHTDAHGSYGADRDGSPRLKGRLRTHTNARYRYHTIDDDPLISRTRREYSTRLGQFAFVQRPDARGVYVQNFPLKPKGDRFEDNIWHGLNPSRRSAGDGR